MALLERAPGSGSPQQPRPTRPRRRPTGSAPGDRPPGHPPRGLVAALVLACATMMALDANDATDPVLDPARAVVGEVLGPAQAGAAALVRPIAAVPEFFRSRSALEQQISSLEAENAELRRLERTSDLDRNRLREFEELTAAAGSLGYALVPARVVGMGAAQDFSSTITIDAGSDAGLSPDQTVVAPDGLVGRVLRVTRTTATVLLVTDADSTVGARMGQSMEVGMLTGRGGAGEKAGLDLELVDGGIRPRRGDDVVTWGSEGGAPYVADVPIGRVTAVFTSLRDQTQRVEVEPFVDMTSLDVVGVVVPSGSASDRAVIEPDGQLR